MAGKKCVWGLEENIAGLVAYAGTAITGILMLIAEKENRTVRFHALQSTMLFGIIAVVQVVIGIVRGIFGWIPLLGGMTTLALNILTGAVSGVTFLLWVFLMYMAYTGKEYELPILGKICRAQVNK